MHLNGDDIDSLIAGIMPGDQPTAPKISLERITKPAQRIIKKSMDSVGISFPTKKEIKTDIITWSIISSVAVVLIINALRKK